MVMVHGRGATADSILSLADALDIDGFAFLAPQASGNTWYPNSFLAPTASNEPGISSGLEAISNILSRLDGAGIPPERTVSGWTAKVFRSSTESRHSSAWVSADRLPTSRPSSRLT
jgi:hypothetical protein